MAPKRVKPKAEAPPLVKDLPTDAERAAHLRRLGYTEPFIKRLLAAQDDRSRYAKLH